MRHLFITVLDCVASWPSAKLTVGASLTEAFRNDMTTCPAGPGLRPSLSLTTDVYQCPCGPQHGSSVTQRKFCVFKGTSRWFYSCCAVAVDNVADGAGAVGAIDIGAKAVGSIAVGAGAVGAGAVGAGAVGAVAVGAKTASG